MYIGARVSKGWKGLVDGDFTKHYVYGTRFESKLKRLCLYGRSDFKVVDGKIVEVENEKRLVITWKAHYDEAAEKDTPSRVAVELAAAAPATTKLRFGARRNQSFDELCGTVEGWPLILSSMKSFLETGRVLVAS
ncbi:MAG: SRPBCC domain-containing protein [Acidobacteria bacterium]|nr:SRPBCC domain-containing protein [Acidobacteriota bacterium]